MTDKYELIDSKVGNLPVQQVCTWAQVSRSGRPLKIEAGVRHCEAPRGTEGRTLQVFSDSQETYGCSRVHAVLQLMNVQAGAELVRALTREFGLMPYQPQPWPATTIPDEAAPATPDLPARDFTVDTPGRKLVSDITYVHTWADILYLATVIGCHTKTVVSW